jgi:hypothetical protein
MKLELFSYFINQTVYASFQYLYKVCWREKTEEIKVRLQLRKSEYFLVDKYVVFYKS